MTEQQWLAATDPGPMLEFLRNSGKASERKLRLFALACCRRIWHLLVDERSRKIIEVAELWADRRITNEQRVEARTLSAFAAREHEDDPAYLANVMAADAATCTAAADIRAYLHSVLYGVDQAVASENNGAAKEEQGRRLAHLRDIFGNPFRPPPTIDPSWLAWNDGTVRRLAAAIYEGRAFERLPLLADALEEAGCAENELLRHLRRPGPHVRGCVALDALLGKG
jgi:hypothetical protein